MTAGQPRVVLLRDRRWPHVAGVCCWRYAVREAFTALDAVVEEAVFDAPAMRPAVGGGAAPRMPWLPQPVRRPLVVAYRGSRSTARRITQRISAVAAPRIPIRGELGGAALVVAESLDAAEAAVDAGAPARRVWALALPADRIQVPDSSDYAAQLARVGAAVGGFLTDSEPARESVERAAASLRPRVEVFPPLAVDRACPSCADSPAQPGASEDTPPEVGQLGAWRRLGAQLPAGGPVESAYSFAAARMLGLSRPWTPVNRPDWTQASSTSTLRAPTASSPSSAWTWQAQLRAARTVLDAVTPQAPTRPRARRSAVVAGFDLKFARDLAARLDNRTDLDVTLDDWPKLGTGTSRSKALMRDAQSIFAEWARPNAVWLSRIKRPDQFLVVRLHRYELGSHHPRNIDIDKVDAVVYVSPPIRRRILDELGWPEEKLVYIPNYLDVDWLDRPKLPQARFGIGFVGMEFANKRFDLALDVLAEVRRHDPRFTLFVRSVMPWNNRYAWPRPAEREFVGWCFERIEQDPLLRGGVVFDPPGRDMARWYRRVGQVLSMSDIESFHLAAAEGMASGAVPVIRPWPGAAEIYDKEWIHFSVEDAAAVVLANADADTWAERAARAKAEIRRTADPAGVVQAWADLLHGDVVAARGYFPN